MKETVRASALLSSCSYFRPGGGLGVFVFALLFCLCCFPAMALPPQNLVMDPPACAVEDGMLTLKLAITVDNEEGLLALLKDGAVLELGIAVQVERKRSFWVNRVAAASEYSLLLRHDPLSRDFVALMPTGQGTKELRDRNLTRLLQSSWRRISLPVVALEDLLREEPAESYLVSLFVSLRHTEVPPWLERSSVFWSADVVPQIKREFVFTPPAQREGGV